MERALEAEADSAGGLVAGLRRVFTARVFFVAILGSSWSCPSGRGAARGCAGTMGAAYAVRNGRHASS